MVRAALEAIAFQVYDVLVAMDHDSGKDSHELRVDGGAVANNFLMQFQSDIFGGKVIRPKVLETTALGAAYLAGLAVGYWGSTDELQKQWSIDKVFEPKMDKHKAEKQLKQWHKAVERAQRWIDLDED